MEEKEKKDDEIEISFSSLKNLFKRKPVRKEDADEPSEEENDDGFDIGDIFGWLKKNKKWVVISLLILLLSLGFLSRIQTIPNLQGQYLSSPDDPYFFLRMSNTVYETGGLPDNDTYRYYPDGQITSSENLGIAYVAGYGLRFVQIFNPDFTMFDVAAWLPAFLLILGLLGFFLLTREMFEDDWMSLLATGFLAFSSAIFFRTNAGFLEKEPLFLPMLVFSLYFFIKAYKSKNYKTGLTLAGVAGLFTGLAGFASGLFVFIGVYISLFAISEVVLEKMNRRKFWILAIWFAVSMIVLNLLTTKYGFLFKDPMSVFRGMQFQIPFVGIFFAGIAAYVPRPKKLKKIPKGVYYGLIAVALVILGGILVFGFNGFAEKIEFFSSKILSPAGEGRFERSVSENQAPSFIGGGRSWWGTFGVNFLIPWAGSFNIGILFLFFLAGSIILFYNEFKMFKYRWWITIAFVFFMLSLIFENFGGGQQYQWISIVFGNQLLYTGIFVVVFGTFLFLEHQKKEHLDKINSIVLFALIWFMVSTIAANGAVRLFFILVFPLVMISAYFLKWSTDVLITRFDTRKWIAAIPYVIGIIIVLASFWSIYQTGKVVGSNLDGWYESMEWIEQNTPEDAVFTHWWDYGYLVQTMGNRTTVVDPGNFYVNRNYDVGGYLFNSMNGTEALDYLDKYSRPNYFLIPSEDVFKFFQIARLGSLSELYGPLPEGETLNREIYFNTYLLRSNNDIVPNNIGDSKEYPFLAILNPSGPSQILQDFRIGDKVYDGDNTFIIRYMMPIDENGSAGVPYVQILEVVTQRVENYPVNCVCIPNDGCHDLNVTGVPTCFISYNGGLLNVPYKAKDTLFVNMYLLGLDIPGFDKVYESPTKLDLSSIHGSGPNVKIYEFNYTELEDHPGSWV